jgi:hypothetical protein
LVKMEKSILASYRQSHGLVVIIGAAALT